MDKRHYFLMIVLTVGALALAACGGAAPTTAPATEPPALAPTAEAPTAGAPPSSEPINLTIWHMEQPPHRVQRFQELIDEFNVANPGIVVTQEVQSWNDIYTKAPAAVAAGNPPDMLFAIPDFTPVIRAVGAVQPVEDLVQELDSQHSLYPSAVAPYTYDGHTWAVPSWNVVHSLWYRKSALEEAGVKPPTTWAELLEAAKKLTTDTQYGIGLPANRQLYTDQTIYDMMINNGAEEIYNDDGTLRFNNPRTVEAFDFYKQLYQYSPPDSPNWMWGEAEACLNSGTCAMILQFAVITTFDAEVGDPAELGVTALPYSPNVDKAGTIAYPCGIMVLSPDPAKKAASYEFIRFLFEPENYGRFVTAEAGLFLPITEDGAKADSFWGDPLITKYKDQIDVMLQNSQNGMLFGFTGGHTFPSIARISAQNLLAQSLQMMLLENMSPADAVAWGQQQMEEAIQ